MKTGIIKIPSDKKLLHTGNIILLVLKETGLLFDFNPEELLKERIKSISKDILTVNDKKARKNQLKKWLNELSGNLSDKSYYDVSELLEESLKNQ